MKCPFCGHGDTQVKDSRPSEDGSAIRRRRFCTACNSRFTTFERVQLRELVVVKKNGDRRIFDREKIVRALTLAMRKRPFPPEQVEQLATRIVQKLESTGESEIPASFIGKTVMDELREIDTVAYIRFASVYRRFQDLDEFREEIDRLAREPAKE